MFAFKPTVDEVLKDFEKMKNKLKDLIDIHSMEIKAHNEIIAVKQNLINFSVGEMTKAENLIKKIEGMFNGY